MTRKPETRLAEWTAAEAARATRHAEWTAEEIADPPGLRELRKQGLSAAERAFRVRDSTGSVVVVTATSPARAVRWARSVRAATIRRARERERQGSSMVELVAEARAWFFQHWPDPDDDPEAVRDPDRHVAEIQNAYQEFATAPRAAPPWLVAGLAIDFVSKVESYKAKLPLLSRAGRAAASAAERWRPLMEQRRRALARLVGEGVPERSINRRLATEEVHQRLKAQKETLGPRALEKAVKKQMDVIRRWRYDEQRKRVR